MLMSFIFILALSYLITYYVIGKKWQYGALIFSLCLFLILLISLVSSSVRKAENMPTIKNETKMYSVKSGMSIDREFVFDIQEGNFGLYQKHEDGYKRVYPDAKGIDFSVDKKLYLIYTITEKKENSNWVFYIPMKSVKKELTLVYNNKQSTFNLK